MDWIPDRSRMTLEQLYDELRLYTDLRDPRHSLWRRMFDWYSAIACFLGVGAAAICFVHGIDWITAALLALCAPGAWHMYRQEQSHKRLNKAIEQIRDELARR